MHLFLKAKDSNQKDYQFEEMKQKNEREGYGRMLVNFRCHPFLDPS